MANERTTWKDAFKMADQVLYMGVRGVTDLMMVHGLVNLDFADIRTVMAEMGKAMMGTGEAEGENRAIRAAEAAINNPLLEETSMAGARGLLINITGGDDLTLFEVDQAANRIREEVDEEANVIFGSAIDETLGGPHPGLGGGDRHRYAGRRVAAAASGGGGWRRDAGAAADPGARCKRRPRMATHAAPHAMHAPAMHAPATTDAAAPAGGANARAARTPITEGNTALDMQPPAPPARRRCRRSRTTAHRAGLRAEDQHWIVRRSAADRRAACAAADHRTAAAQPVHHGHRRIPPASGHRLRRWKQRCRRGMIRCCTANIARSRRAAPPCACNGCRQARKRCWTSRLSCAGRIS